MTPSASPFPRADTSPAFELADPSYRTSPIGIADVVTPGIRLGWENVQRLLVLPFHAQVKSEVNQTLAEGLFDQLNVELARYSDISVVTKQTTSVQTDAPVDPVTAGANVRAQFVVSGNVRQDRDQIRITARLHDVHAGAIIQSDCLDLSAALRLGLQTEDRASYRGRRRRLLRRHLAHP